MEITSRLRQTWRIPSPRFQGLCEPRWMFMLSRMLDTFPGQVTIPSVQAHPNGHLNNCLLGFYVKDRYSIILDILFSLHNRIHTCNWQTLKNTFISSYYFKMFLNKSNHQTWNNCLLRLDYYNLEHWKTSAIGEKFIYNNCSRQNIENISNWTIRPSFPTTQESFAENFFVVRDH